MSTHNETRTEDAVFADQLKSHHAVMVADLDRLSAALAAAAAAGNDAAPPKRALAEWVKDVLVPHAEEEERTTYEAALQLPEGKLLIESMLSEHVLIRQTAQHVFAAENPLEAGAYGRALFAIFESHQRKENDLILPLLVASDSVSLTGLFDHGEGHGHSHDHGHGH